MNMFYIHQTLVTVSKTDLLCVTWADMTLHDMRQICMTHDTGLVTECEISMITKHIIQYSYYDNEPAGDQFITFIASHHITQSPTKSSPKTDKFLV